MNNEKLFEGVGKTAKIDHVAVQTAFGMLIAATTLFKRLGYEVHPTRKAEGQWGKAIFMVKEGSISIQLTDSSAEELIRPSDNHIGIMVDDPLTVSTNIVNWVRRGGISVDEPESVAGGKYFVWIPEIVTQMIELVPAPCPECGGTGEVVRGSEGRGFYYLCDTCHGRKVVSAS